MNFPSLLLTQLSSSVSDEQVWWEYTGDAALLSVFSSMRVPPARLAEHAMRPGDGAVLLPPGRGWSALQPMSGWVFWISPLPPLPM